MLCVLSFWRDPPHIGKGRLVKQVLEETIGRIRAAEAQADAVIAEARAEAARTLDAAKQEAAALAASEEAAARAAPGIWRWIWQRESTSPVWTATTGWKTKRPTRRCWS